MQAIRISPLTPERREELDTLYRQTRVPRLRTRAQMVLLSAEQGYKVPTIALIVRESQATVGRWLKRYAAEGVEGLRDAPRSGRPSEIIEAFRTQWVEAVRRRPRSLQRPFYLWTLQRLVDYMAEETGQRVSTETVRRVPKTADIVLSRPQHMITSPDPEYQVKKRRLRVPATPSNRGIPSITPMNSI